VAQLGVAALDKGGAIACEPRRDLSHACSPEGINIYGLVSMYIRGIIGGVNAMKM
jgi:hypothetical protein